MFRFFLPFFFVSLSACVADFNEIVLEQIKTMPTGGGYSVTREAHEALKKSVSAGVVPVRIDVGRAQPSYCSGATYLVFLKALAVSEAKAGGSTSEDYWPSLRPNSLPDGVGVWGRWNSNGPGTARLFHELGLGRNFTSWAEARPGDFMKIFWSDAVGKKERGHSVVFLGTEMVGGIEYVRFWSSNKPGGYGEKSVPKSKIARALFSRLESPSNISKAPSLPVKDDYLAGLLVNESSFSEALKKCGVAGN